MGSCKRDRQKRKVDGRTHSFQLWHIRHFTTLAFAVLCSGGGHNFALDLEPLKLVKQLFTFIFLRGVSATLDHFCLTSPQFIVQSF